MDRWREAELNAPTCLHVVLFPIGNIFFVARGYIGSRDLGWALDLDGRPEAHSLEVTFHSRGPILVVRASAGGDSREEGGQHSFRDVGFEDKWIW
jgi:hypothetical protein